MLNRNLKALLNRVKLDAKIIETRITPNKYLKKIKNSIDNQRIIFLTQAFFPWAYCSFASSFASFDQIA